MSTLFGIGGTIVILATLVIVLARAITWLLQDAIAILEEDDLPPNPPPAKANFVVPENRLVLGHFLIDL